MRTLVLFIIPCVLACSVADQVIRPSVIIRDVNRERKNNDIIYNHTVHDILMDFAKKCPADWFYRRSNFSHKVSMIQRVQKDNGMWLVREPSVVGDVEDEEIFQKLKDDNWFYMFRDTCKRYADTIFRYRNGQRNCFKLSNCNSEEFFDYWSCLKKMPHVPIIKPGYEKDRCAWAPYYYPKIVHSKLLEIACVGHNYKTPYVPEGLNQPYSFHCYGKFNGDPYLNDRFIAY